MRKSRQSVEQSKRAAQVAAAIQNSVYGWVIPMMQIPRIYKAGEVAAGVDGPVNEDAIRIAVTGVLEIVAVRS